MFLLKNNHSSELKLFDKSYDLALYMLGRSFHNYTVYSIGGIIPITKVTMKSIIEELENK